MAFEKNWDLLAAKANVDQATAQKIISHEFPNPTLSYSTAKISTDGQPAGTGLGNGFFDRSYDTIIAVNQLIEIGGKREARQRSAQAGWKSAVEAFKDAKRLLDLGVTKAYIAALLAEENVCILRESAASLRHEAEIASKRLMAGDISQADKQRIDIAASQLELNAASAADTAKQARVALDVLMGARKPTGK